MHKPITHARVRMYNPGLGDCFLLTFGNGEEESHVLIDCGIFTGTPHEKKRIVRIAEHIRDTTGNKLNALVATHEHWDHVSGFYYADEIFKPMNVEEVWVGWTEDPDQQVVKERRSLKLSLMNALNTAVRQLSASELFEDHERGKAIADVLAFDGEPSGIFNAPAFAKRSDKAMENVINLKKPSQPFLSPGDVIERSWIPGVRVYVLGPPKNLDFLRTMEGAHNVDQYGFSPGHLDAWLSGLMRAAGSETGLQAGWEEFTLLEPFDRVHQWTEAELLNLEKSDGDRDEAGKTRSIISSYRKEGWRRIDSTWLNTAARLALQLDNMTNNTSLVLAFELVKSGRVLLFVGDAQIGSWQSWQECTWEVKDVKKQTKTVSAQDLMKRTVFYKVGHHGSINATSKKDGLELMTSPDLVAAIPTDEKFARNKKGWEMPAPNLKKVLLEKSRGRLLRADSNSKPVNGQQISQKSWRSFLKSVDIDESAAQLYVDFTIKE
jgi:hypothetical protein